MSVIGEAVGGVWMGVVVSQGQCYKGHHTIFNKHSTPSLLECGEFDGKKQTKKNWTSHIVQTEAAHLCTPTAVSFVTSSRNIQCGASTDFCI